MSEDSKSQTQGEKRAPPTPDTDAKTPPAPNEGRLGPAADPAEGKRD